MILGYDDEIDTSRFNETEIAQLDAALWAIQVDAMRRGEWGDGMLDPSRRSGYIAVIAKALPTMRLGIVCTRCDNESDWIGEDNSLPAANDPRHQDPSWRCSMCKDRP